MGNRDLAVLMSALLLVRHLIFYLNTAGASFNHLLGHQVGCFGITETRVDIGNNRYDMGLKVVNLRLYSGFGIALRCIQFAEKAT